MQTGDLSRIGSREYAREVAHLWDRLLGDYEVSQIGVRDIVYQSWLRCKKIGVDPLKRAAPKAPPLARPTAVSEARLRAVVHASLNSVAPYLSEARSVLIGSGRTGNLFFVGGDTHLSEALAENSVVAGATWEETKIGTNAIGTALEIEQKVLIHGEEHFCNAGKPWSCAADVIRDPVDRSVLGIVDLTGPAEAVALRANALISALVERIESELSRLDLLDRINLIDLFHERKRLGEGLVVVDRRGLIIRATSQSPLEAANIRQGEYLAGLKGLSSDKWTLDLTHEVLHGAEVEWIAKDDEVIGAAIHVSPRPIQAPARANLPTPLKTLQDSAPSQSLLVQKAAILAQNSLPVLITGETGTGKDVLANAIHLSGPRARKPLISVNCAAIPRELIGVELFGYVEGAFTGTRRGGMSGRIEDANGGTLFLDELGDMPLDVQPYLLRVIETGLVSRLGESRQRQVDVRIIAATNQPIEQLKDDGRFRSDLYYRLNGARLHIAPLRQRRQDIPALAERIYAQIRKSDQSRPLDRDAIDHLMTQDLPGNTRELRTKIERYVAGLPIDDDALKPPSAAAGTLAGIERDAILGALARHGGNVGLVSDELSIPRSTLYRKLAEYRAKGS
ncbi:sigma-54-dependent Fis family transcriptional regulator [Bradyrhizobium mercantei]|uniref:sigma-54-dependent Fis family transcriptional regulator n=1 Tax=Bradyrhizobium mercantei TaxID=1904807 RepID=UPI0009766D23|nr:sigma-54-dependent Fis family transcriptional regulator [Bradyrhizobium mercantei]